MSEAVISLFIGVSVLFAMCAVLEVSVWKDIKNFFTTLLDDLAENLGKYNFKRRTARLKRENIVTQKDNIFAKYNRFIDGLIVDFKLENKVTLESLTSIVAIIFAVVTIAATFFLKNITVAFMIAVSLTIGAFTLFSVRSRMERSIRAEAIADAEDAICPLARDGVLVAIKKVMDTGESIHKSIRPYFYEFIDNCETGGYSFRQAMTILNKRLGSRFDNFAKKAIIFEYNERKGMAEVFLDIVDENAVIREINAKKEDLFKKMDKDFLMKIIIIVLFFIYSLSVTEFREFMLTTTAGKIINSLSLNVICISFAASQVLQGSLELKRKK